MTTTKRIWECDRCGATSSEDKLSTDHISTYTDLCRACEDSFKHWWREGSKK